jgi:glycolate oxidase FAD binding subunit
MEPALAQLRDRILAARDSATTLRLRGSGSKDFYGERVEGEILDTRAYCGIVAYEPTELVVTARCGTPLSQIDAALADHGQFLAFEPPRFAGDPTIGGIVAAGLSGPRRIGTGAVRDFVLGASLLDGHGELLTFGGQVMKNVAGFDVSRLLCGSLGILGLIAQVSIKVLPQPRAELTLQLEHDANAALACFNGLRAQPLPVSATSWHEGAARIRLSGSDSALAAARKQIGGTEVAAPAAQAWWHGMRDQTHPFFSGGGRLWRLSLPATAPIGALGADLIEWSGALRWLRSDVPAAQMRRAAESLGGTAMLWRGHGADPMFHPLPAANLELHRHLKRQFDPHGIFNPGRMVA